SDGHLSCSFTYVLCFNLFLISIPLFFALPHRQEFRMARWKREVIDKIQAFLAQPVSDNVSGVFSAELAKLFGINDHPFATPGFYVARFKPASADPFLHLLRTDMESDSQCVFGEAVLPHLGVCSQTPQHVPDRALGASHQLGDLGHGMQIEKLY